MSSLPFRLDHLFRMTDDTGILQHGLLTIPDPRHGYTTDDNARALVTVLELHTLTGDKRLLDLAERYLRFLCMVRRAEGGFHNFVGYDRRILDEVGSEDCQGQVVWALGAASAGHLAEGTRRTAHHLYRDILPVALRLSAPRAQAFAILGLSHDAGRSSSPVSAASRAVLKHLANSLLERYRATAGQGWYWFEEGMTYANAVLPRALFAAHRVLGRAVYLEAAEESFDFLVETVGGTGTLRFVGNRGWYERNSRKAQFDEQPIDAGHLAATALDAWGVTGRPQYLDLVAQAWSWFLGNNVHRLALYDSATGACYDGLTPDGLNLNCGAESLLALCWAHCASELAARRAVLGRNAL